MRILHLVMAPRYSGAEVLVRDLSLYHQRQGAEVGICAFAPSDVDFQPQIDRLRNAGVKIYLPQHPLRRISRLRMVRQWTREFAPDILAAHSVIPAAYARLALLSRRRPRIVSVLHSQNNYCGGGPMKLMERLLARKAAAVVCVSPKARENYEQDMPPHPHLTVVSNGIHAERFVAASQERQRCRRELGLSDETQLALQVGRFDRVKRQHLTLQAMLPVLKRQPNLVLWFAGIMEDAEYCRELRKAVEESGMSDRISFLGARSDVAELLSAADLALLPSRMEAQPVTLLESLASGVQIIGSDIEAMQFARSYPGVHLLDPTSAEAMAACAEAILSHPIRYQRDLSRYSMDAAAAAYMNVFQLVCRD